MAAGLDPDPNAPSTGIDVSKQKKVFSTAPSLSIASSQSNYPEIGNKAVAVQKKVFSTASKAAALRTKKTLETKVQDPQEAVIAKKMSQVKIAADARVKKKAPKLVFTTTAKTTAKQSESRREAIKEGAKGEPSVARPVTAKPSRQADAGTILTRKFGHLSGFSISPDLCHFVVPMPVTDPDFPYALESLLLDIHVDSEQKNLSIRVHQSQLTEVFRTRIDGEMAKAAQFKPQDVLSALTFLERNLESWLGAPSLHPSAPESPSLGVVRLIKPQEIRVSSSPEAMPQDADDNVFPDGPVFFEDRRPSSTEPSNYVQVAPMDAHILHRLDTRPIVLHRVQCEGISMLSLPSITLSIRCLRCRAVSLGVTVRSLAERLEHCAKCHCRFILSYWPDLAVVDAQSGPGKDAVNQAYSDVQIGAVHVKGGSPEALTGPMPLQLSCNNTDCQEKPLEQCTAVLGKVQGFPLKAASRCPSCYSALTCRWETATFSPPTNTTSSPTKRMEAGKKKETALQEGKPLPSNGTCSHYKRSYRWYRFPCCNQLFPCDQCHEDAQKSGALTPRHTIAVWAERIVCGWCSREQNSQNGKCAGCGAPLKGTADNSGHSGRTTHWEGGKGMRNHVTMNRKDSKKYSGLTKPKPHQ